MHKCINLNVMGYPTLHITKNMTHRISFFYFFSNTKF